MIAAAYVAAGVVYLAAILHAVLYHCARGRTRARHRHNEKEIP